MEQSCSGSRPTPKTVSDVTLAGCPRYTDTEPVGINSISLSKIFILQAISYRQPVSFLPIVNVFSCRYWPSVKATASRPSPQGNAVPLLFGRGDAGLARTARSSRVLQLPVLICRHPQHPSHQTLPVCSSWTGTDVLRVSASDGLPETVCVGQATGD